MPVIAIDLGATKAAFATVTADGATGLETVHPIYGLEGSEVAAVILRQVDDFLNAPDARKGVDAVGICVPGISYRTSGRVWAPNIPGWDDYPLRDELSAALGGIPVHIDSDRACYILGERWLGAARGSDHAIYLSVGTGIGAGILVDGRVLRGAHDIAGAIGWMGLDRPFRQDYSACGCFETHASGGGLGRKVAALAAPDTAGEGRGQAPSAADLFAAAGRGEDAALRIIDEAIECWGMAVANLVSLFDPDTIVFGGGVFGPSVQYIPRIAEEARKWAQPIAMRKVRLTPSALGGRAGLMGAAWMAMQATTEHLTS
ncbi:MAG: ROK family protein [Chitinophagia bacterium]|nr:ROK family protein [Chitinophagia bacterium]